MYYAPHLRKTALERRLIRIRRVLRSVINPPGFDDAPASLTAACYWTGEVDSSWDNKGNWASSSGGSGGYGVPTPTNAVVFDGTSGANGSCTLKRPVTTAALSFTEADAAVAAEFVQNGYAISCTTFTYNCPTANSGEVFDGVINVSGATFTVTAAENADHFGADMYVDCAANVTVASAVALAGTFFCQHNFTTVAALSLGRLIMDQPGSTMTFFHGVNFTLIAYTAGDWDGFTLLTNDIVSDDASTWGFVNPAGMVTNYIDVQDSNATNEVNALTSNGNVDGTGNTNWTFT